MPTEPSGNLMKQRQLAKLAGMEDGHGGHKDHCTTPQTAAYMQTFGLKMMLKLQALKYSLQPIDLNHMMLQQTRVQQTVRINVCAVELGHHQYLSNKLQQLCSQTSASQVRAKQPPPPDTATTPARSPQHRRPRTITPAMSPQQSHPNKS